jgi:hypothetical protein
LKNSKLADRLSMKPRTINRRRTDCLRMRLGDWLRRKKFGDKRRRRNRNGRRRRNLEEEAEKEYTRQKELEKARLEKQKAVKIEESREEMEKKLQGFNKKVSKMLLLGLVTNGREIDKIQTGQMSDHASL